MADYRAGDVIRLTRNAVGMSQEELCDGICSVQTLSHIENNKHRIKPDTYRQLMEKMGRGVHNNCAVCMGKDMSLLEEYPLFEDAMAKRDYHVAERYLTRIREKISDYERTCTRPAVRARESEHFSAGLLTAPCIESCKNLALSPTPTPHPDNCPS